MVESTPIVDIKSGEMHQSNPATTKRLGKLISECRTSFRQDVEYGTQTHILALLGCLFGANMEISSMAFFFAVPCSMKVRAWDPSAFNVLDKVISEQER